MATKQETEIKIHRNTGNGGREVKLHPLVLINISDHFTREKVRDITSDLYSTSERVAGVLFGVQTGKVVDVLESFEMSYEILDTGVLKFDEQFLSSKKRQFTAIFPNYEILGWYTTGATVLVSHLETHMAMTDLNPNPIMLTLDPHAEDEDSLPVKILETQVTGSGESVFVELDYKIDTLEPERVCVDHISNQKPQTDTSPIAEHSKSLTSALMVMRERIATIQQFLADVRSGQREADPIVMRRIHSLCHCLPAGSSVNFQAALLNEANDSSLITYLSELTNIACSVRSTKSKIMTTFSDNSQNNIMMRKNHMMSSSMGGFPAGDYGEFMGGRDYGGGGGGGRNRGRARRRN